MTAAEIVSELEETKKSHYGFVTVQCEDDGWRLWEYVLNLARAVAELEKAAPRVSTGGKE
jgi:hypothetical protein